MLDLFSLVVEKDKCSPNFLALLTDEMADVRQVLTQWSKTFQDRDGNFVIEFQSKFNQQFWELYLHATFDQMGLEPEYGYDRPDYSLKISGVDVAGEATTTQHVPSLAPEWVRDWEDFADTDTRVVFHHGTIRFGNSFSSKLKKYRGSYSQLSHVQDKPFLLAIGHYEQPMFYLNGHLPALRVLFGLDEPLHIAGEDSQYLVGIANRPSEWKSTETEIEFGYFRDDRASEISAVLVSSLATVGKCHALAEERSDDRVFFSTRFSNDGLTFAQIGVGTDYEESLVDGLHLFVNPFAQHPISWQPFFDAGISVHLFSEEEGYEVKTLESNLSTRWTLGFKGVDDQRWRDLKTRAAQAKQNRLPRASLPVWEEGKLVPQAVLTIFMEQPLHDQHHLSHYRGWTIHVCRDVTDNDWFGQAVPGIHLDVQGVINQNQRDDREGSTNLVGLVHSRPTKETALRELASRIDSLASPEAQ